MKEQRQRLYFIDKTQSVYDTCGGVVPRTLEALWFPYVYDKFSNLYYENLEIFHGI